MGATTTGKIFVTDEYVTKVIDPGELNYYLSIGWRRGRAGHLPTQVPCKSCGKLICRFDGKSGKCRDCLKAEGYYQKLWQDPTYREKVIKGTTGKKRSEEFRKKQSENMKQYYKEHPERRDAQSAVFSKAWKDGKHTEFFNRVGHGRYQHSRGENMMFNALCNEFGTDHVKRCCLFEEGGKTSRSIFPDALINGVWLIEYYGDFFHANPDLYDPDDLACYDSIASDVWERDQNRIKFATSYCNKYKDLDTSEIFDACPTVVSIIWEGETSNLANQQEWNSYIHNRFLGWDEYLSI